MRVQTSKNKTLNVLFLTGYRKIPRSPMDLLDPYLSLVQMKFSTIKDFRYISPTTNSYMIILESCMAVEHEDI